MLPYVISQLIYPTGSQPSNLYGLPEKVHKIQNESIVNPFWATTNLYVPITSKSEECCKQFFVLIGKEVQEMRSLYKVAL